MGPGENIAAASKKKSTRPIAASLGSFCRQGEQVETNVSSQPAPGPPLCLSGKEKSVQKEALLNMTISNRNYNGCGNRAKL